MKGQWSLYIGDLAKAGKGCLQKLNIISHSTFSFRERNHFCILYKIKIKLSRINILILAAVNGQLLKQVFSEIDLMYKNIAMYFFQFTPISAHCLLSTITPSYSLHLKVRTKMLCSFTLSFGGKPKASFLESHLYFLLRMRLFPEIITSYLFLSSVCGIK